MEDIAGSLPTVTNSKMATKDKSQDQCEPTLSPTWYNLYDSHLHITEETVKVEHIDEGNNEAIGESDNNTCNENIREKAEIKVEVNDEEDSTFNTEVDVNVEKVTIKNERVYNDEQEATNNTHFSTFEQRYEIKIENGGALLGSKETEMDESSEVCDFIKQVQKRRNNSLTPLRNQNTALPRRKELVVVLEDIMLSNYNTQRKQFTDNVSSTKQDMNAYRSSIKNRIIFEEDDHNILETLTNSANTIKALKYENSTTDNSYASDPYNISQTSRTRTRHVNSNHLIPNESLKKLFICDICNKRFHCKSTLTRHILKHPKMHYCIYCRYKTIRKFDLDSHINAQHTKSTVYNCSDCNFETYHKYSLRLHVNSKHFKKTLKCSYCRFKTYRKSNLDQHINTQHTRSNIFSCTHCSYKAYEKKKLHKHINSQHTKSTVFNCSECSYKAFHTNDLNRHIMYKHTKTNVFNCTYCSYKSFHKSDLKRHINARHTKSAVFNCSHCNFKTYHKSSIQKHINAIHTNSKVFNCSYCSYKAYQKGNLAQHINYRHTKSIAFNCTICSYKGYNKFELGKHIKRKHS